MTSASLRRGAAVLGGAALLVGWVACAGRGEAPGGEPWPGMSRTSGDERSAGERRRGPRRADPGRSKPARGGDGSEPDGGPGGRGAVCQRGVDSQARGERADDVVACAPPLRCCYPCGMEGCDYVCATGSECASWSTLP
ncbi:MAG: hypothetical protein H6713_23370 [Myxococcales bacterium]|nr:hypothetical protein [Myxococcales bacterium]